uniref:Uncharacterized protein n=1 Tax=Arundo donax TaxID=35708 RepID=A0A0A9FR19_ARUDO
MVKYVSQRLVLIAKQQVKNNGGSINLLFYVNNMISYQD